MASKPVPCEKGASLRRAFLLHVEGQVTEGEDCATTFHDPFPGDVGFKPLTTACAGNLAEFEAPGNSCAGLGHQGRSKVRQKGRMAPEAVWYLARAAVPGCPLIKILSFRTLQRIGAAQLDQEVSRRLKECSSA